MENFNIVSKDLSESIGFVFRGIVNSKEELDKIQDAHNGDVYIIRAKDDESAGPMYVYNDPKFIIMEVAKKIGSNFDTIVDAISAISDNNGNIQSEIDKNNVIQLIALMIMNSGLINKEKTDKDIINWLNDKGGTKDAS